MADNDRPTGPAGIVPPVNAESLMREVLEREGRQQDEPGMLLSEVENLLWIQDNRLYKAALDRWQGRGDLLTERAQNHASRIEGVKNGIWELVGFSSVFLGVVLTAVTQMTQAHNSCKKVWSPALLIALAWISTLLAVWQKLGRIQEIEHMRTIEAAPRKVFLQLEQTLRRQGKMFRFKDHENLYSNGKDLQLPKTYVGLSASNWIKKFAPIAVALSLFSGVFVASCFSILCDRWLAPINDP